MFLQKENIQNQIDRAGKKKKRMFALVLVLLLLLQLGVLVYYGNRKTGFHEDEFYSYYTTNKTAGLFINDRTWIARDDFRNDFVVLPGEEFRYEVVKQMQSWDVHPPFYYYLLHTVCSFSTEIFSKWQGILVNLTAFVPCYFLLFYLVYCSMKPWKEAEEKAAKQAKKSALLMGLVTCMFWGFGAAVISGAMFIRMYQWLTLFVLLCAVLHVKALKEDRYGLSFYVPLTVTAFLGFLTQYYYFIFHFFMGAGFCLLLLKRKQIKELFSYGISCALGMGGAILYYPSALSHIFRGYRGTEAVSEFGDASNTLGRLRFFIGLFDDYVMNGTLSVFLLFICLLWLTLHTIKKGMIQRKQPLLPQADIQVDREVWLLLFTCLGYFFTISKTALLLGETSNRYQLPVYGILIFLLLYYLWIPFWGLMQICRQRKADQKKEKALNEAADEAAVSIPKWQKVTAAASVLCLLLIDVAALASGKVFFLYEEEKQMQEFVQENSEVPVVVFYHEASPDNVWRISDQLMEVPQIYLASQGNKDVITDEIITESEKLLVYVADYENQEDCLENLLKSNDRLSEYRVIDQKGLWTLYEME